MPCPPASHTRSDSHTKVPVIEGVRGGGGREREIAGYIPPNTNQREEGQREEVAKATTAGTGSYASLQSRPGPARPRANLEPVPVPGPE